MTNHMKEIARILGVEIGERFKINFGGGLRVRDDLYWFDENYTFGLRADANIDPEKTLLRLIRGTAKIIKLP